MIEITILDYMSNNLPVPVYMEFPSDPDNRFVVLRKGNSERENLVDTSTFVVDSYAESLLEAAKLNEQVKAALDSLIELDTISGSKRGGDYPFYDTKNKRYRYQAVQNITHY